MHLDIACLRVVGVFLLLSGGCTLDTPDSYSTTYPKILNKGGLKPANNYWYGNYNPLVIPTDAAPVGPDEKAAFEGSGVKKGFQHLLSQLCDESKSSSEELLVSDSDTNVPQVVLVHDGHLNSVERPQEKEKKKVNAYAPEQQCKGQGKLPETDAACWISRHRKVKWCADKVARYTVDQCATLVGGQNRYAARFAEVMLPFLAVTGLAGDVAAATAIAAKGNTTTAALTAAILTSAGDVQKVIPSATSVKASDLTTSEASYLMASDFKSEGLPCRESQAGKPDDACQANDLIYSQLHDALLSACPALNP
jgi:hypothetical protein